MEKIYQAVERAKTRSDQGNRPLVNVGPQQVAGRQGAALHEISLDPKHLQSRRIVAYDGKDLRSRPFDILRTEILRSMDMKNWKTIAVTSATAGCGKTFTATNLAFSIARQADRTVCLVDLDMRRPQVAACLGLRGSETVLDVIEGRGDLAKSTVLARVGNSRLEVVPTTPCGDPSDLVGSAAMRAFLQDLTGYGPSRITILDLPPLLTSHDAMSILPQVDCVLLVAAVGNSKVSEIKECNKYLQTSEVVRVVLNKVPESTMAYGYY
jgi:protein-tyrosine kinase